MNEEELIKRIESTELPAIELKSYRRRLKMNLLNSAGLEKRQSTPAGIKGGIYSVISVLFSKRTVWKTAGVSILAVALVVGVGLTISLLSTRSTYAKAIDIAKNSPEVQAALGEEEVQEGKVIKWVDNKGTIILEGKMIRIIVVVDMESKKVIEGSFTISSNEVNAAAGILTEAEKEEAINIAKADPKVKELLDQGAVIPTGEVERVFSVEDKTAQETGVSMIVVTKLQVQMQVHLGDKIWRVRVDPNEKQVVLLMKIPPDITP